MAQADFDYKFRDTFTGERVLIIYDLNLGGKSVTNDIENVLQKIQRVNGPLPRLIIYRDSEGRFDGVKADGEVEFIPIRETGEEAAIVRAVTHPLNS